MTPDEARALLETDDVARSLLAGRTPARLAYIGEDGTPRCVPIGFHWNGGAFVLATAEFAPKVAALRSRPAVALSIDSYPPDPLAALLVRGTASVTVVDGVPAEYLEASRRTSPPEQWDDFARQARALYPRMARIEIVPVHVTILDFVTRAPREVERLARLAAERDAAAAAG